jgi:hypothetical protein
MRGSGCRTRTGAGTGSKAAGAVGVVGIQIRPVLVPPGRFRRDGSEGPGRPVRCALVFERDQK